MTEQTVQVGERLAVSYDITNRGQSDGEQTVELTLDGEVANSDALVLDTGKKDRMSLVTDAFTDEDDGQLYEVEIVTDDRVAQVMTVEVTDIPDESVWQSLDSSEDFWLEYAQSYGSNVDWDSDTETIGRAGSGGVDAIMSDRPNWFDLGDYDNIDETKELRERGEYDLYFDPEDDRYIHTIEKVGGDNGAGITVLGPWDGDLLESVDSLHYFHRFDDDGSGSAGSAIVLAEPESDTNYEIIDTIEAEVTTVDESYDISDISDDREILLMTNQATEANPIADYADIYFE